MVMYGEVIQNLVPSWFSEFKHRPSYTVVKGLIRTLISLLVILSARSISDEAMATINWLESPGSRNTMLHLAIVMAITYNSSEDMRIMMIVGILYLIISMTVLRKIPLPTSPEKPEKRNEAEHATAYHTLNQNTDALN